MKIQTVAIDRVKPYENNPRVVGLAVDKVAESIKQFGWQQPIVVDENFVIIAGHTRYLAARKLELTKVPVHIASLSPEQAKAYRIADNATSEYAEWNWARLSAELTGLEELDPTLLEAVSLTDRRMARITDFRQSNALEGISNATEQGVLPRDTQAELQGEFVPFSAVLTHEQRSQVYAGINKAKHEFNIEKAGDALHMIVKRYLDG